MKATLISLAFLTVLISPRLAMACSCAGTPAVCESFAAAEAVFVGTVTRVEDKTVKAPDGREAIVGQTANVQVEESFKGAKESAMIFRSYGTSCDTRYEEGQRWLFYAYFNRDDKAWQIQGCDHSTLLERAADDLLYLRHLPASAQKTRISGEVRNGASKSMMGIKIKVTDGQKVYETFTDKDGVYELVGLPPRKYSVEPDVPNPNPQREKAIELLKSLATQLTTLQSAENRARIGVNIADSLWAHDEKRARAIFISIEDDIRWGIYDREINHPRDEYASMVFMQLRTDTLARIAKHDPELALDFLKATAPTYENPPRSVIERERDLEVKLAAKISAGNPDLALKLGRESLNRGVSNELLPLLRQLLKKHREQGLTLYKETVRKVRDVSVKESRKTLDFARALAEVITPPLADDSAYQELIKDFGPAPNRHLVMLNGQPGLSALEQVIAAGGDVDDMVEIAQKFPQNEGSIYWAAAEKAEEEGDSERARKIAKQITDPWTQRRLLETLDAVDGITEISDEDMASLEKELNEITRIENRIDFLVNVVSGSTAKNRAKALKLLDETAEMLETEKPAKNRILSELALALLYCVEKSDRGLAMMESLLPRLNELIDAAAKLDGFDVHYMRDGEWNMSADGNLGELLTFLAQNAAYYAWCDFDRAVKVAAQFDRSEIRMMAQVKLAQSILAGPPKAFRVTRGSGY